MEVLEIAKKKGDYFIVDHSCTAVWYSRYFGSGVYQVIFKYSLFDGHVSIDDRVSGHRTRFDISSPDMHGKMAETIVKITNRLQNGRKEHGSAGGIETRHAPAVWEEIKNA